MEMGKKSSNPLIVAWLLMAAGHSFDLITTMLGVIGFGYGVESNPVIRLLLEKYGLNALFYHGTGVMASFYITILFVYLILSVSYVRNEVIQIVIILTGVVMAIPHYMAGFLNLIQLWIVFDAFSIMPVGLIAISLYGFFVLAAWAYGVREVAFGEKRMLEQTPPVEGVPILREPRLSKRVRIATMDGLQDVAKRLNKPIFIKEGKWLNTRHFYVINGDILYEYRVIGAKRSLKDVLRGLVQNHI
jgi:hypothetical protein